ncbi:MAG: zinc ribbon domain-containing protein [Geitlerinemataceae cyanobacterium]
MWPRLKRFFQRSVRRTRTIDDEPLNRVSITIILLIDLFILANVFSGLNDISSWHLAPNEAHPCHQNWREYRRADSANSTDSADNSNALDRDFAAVRRAADLDRAPFAEQYAPSDRLGRVSSICLQYAEVGDAVRTTDNTATLTEIGDKELEVETLRRESATIREQYDSSLLEEIANQPRDRSIVDVDAADAKQTLDRNDAQIARLEAEIADLKSALIARPESRAFLELLNRQPTFTQVDRGYRRATFWYPSIQLSLQALFLLPLLFVAYVVHQQAQRARHGTIALMSWHLLIIFSIPLVFKLFEFLQIGAVFSLFADLVRVLFGSLLFLVSYIYIFLIPIVGFGLIKLFQRFVFNPKRQARNRIQRSRCIQCAAKLPANATYCPHCGYGQYRECPSCHALTHKYLPYCETCGAAQDIG